MANIPMKYWWLLELKPVNFTLSTWGHFFCPPPPEKRGRNNQCKMLTLSVPCNPISFKCNTQVRFLLYKRTVTAIFDFLCPPLFNLDFQEQCGRWHGQLQQSPVQPRGDSRPLCRHQVRAPRGGQQKGHGRVHVRDNDGRDQHIGHPQHVRGLAAGQSPHHWPHCPGWTVWADPVQSGKWDLVPEI